MKILQGVTHKLRNASILENDIKYYQFYSETNYSLKRLVYKGKNHELLIFY